MTEHSPSTARPSNAIVNLGSAVTLSGGGTVTMSSGTGNAYLRGSGLTLTNTNDTIQGAGLIGDSGALAIVNKGTINANSSGQSLNVEQGGGAITNTGTLEATGGGVLNLYGTVTNKTGGVITANGGTVNVIGTVSGGTLNTLNSGVMESSGGSADLSGVTISSGSTYTTGPGTADAAERRRWSLTERSPLTARAETQSSISAAP